MGRIGWFPFSLDTDSWSSFGLRRLYSICCADSTVICCAPSIPSRIPANLDSCVSTVGVKNPFFVKTSSWYFISFLTKKGIWIQKSRLWCRPKCWLEADTNTRAGCEQQRRLLLIGDGECTYWVYAGAGEVQYESAFTYFESKPCHEANA